MISSSILYYLLALILVVPPHITLARPQNQNSIDVQDFFLDQTNIPELKKLYSAYNSVNYPGEESNVLDRLQLQLLAQYANNVGGGGGGGWEQQLYRTPEMKRQIRYRQCYFNPISCFKK